MVHIKRTHNIKIHDIKEARNRIASIINRTPIIHSSILSEKMGRVLSELILNYTFKPGILVPHSFIGNKLQ